MLLLYAFECLSSKFVALSAMDNIVQKAHRQKRGFRYYKLSTSCPIALNLSYRGTDSEASLLPVRFLRISRIGMMQDHHVKPGGNPGRLGNPSDCKKSELFTLARTTAH